MSNKTEANKEGLPASDERGSDGAQTPAKAGVGPRTKVSASEEGAPSTNPEAPKGKAWFRVKGPGGVFLNGVLLKEGDTMQMNRTEAQSVDEHVEEIPTPG